MGCMSSKAENKYSVSGSQFKENASSQLGANSALADPSKWTWPDGLDKRFHFKLNIESEWEIFPEILGRGSFGIVKKCRRKGDPNGEICAVKIIAKNKLEIKEDVEDLRVEVDCMRRLGRGSLNCIALYDAYEEKDKVYLVMEMATGGELYDRIKKGRYTEKQASQIAFSIIQMVAQCHAKNIVYRDIKPNNFLFSNETPKSPLKATDFGLACHHPPGSKPLRDTTGTPYYIAPEVVRRSYGFEADVWSAGALIYQLLCGKVPFPPNPKLGGREVIVDLFQRILKAPIDLEKPPTWPKVSDAAKDLVGRMLERDISKRISIQDALAHPWFKDKGAPNEPLDGDVVQRLQRYSTYGKFRQMAMVAALEKSKADGGVVTPWAGDIEKLKKMFNDMDTDGNGNLSLQEVKTGLKAAGYQLTDNEIQQLFDAIDIDGGGSLSVEEFMVAMLDWQAKQDSEVLKEVDEESDDEGNGSDAIWKDLFDKYDTNNDGTISPNEIAHIMHVGEDSPEIKDLLREADVDGSGGISLSEFKQLMMGNRNDDLAIYSMRRSK